MKVACEKYNWARRNLKQVSKLPKLKIIIYVFGFPEDPGTGDYGTPPGHMGGHCIEITWLETDI